MAARGVGDAHEPEDQGNDAEDEEQGHNQVAEGSAYLKAQNGDNNGNYGVNDVENDEVDGLRSVKTAEFGVGSYDDRNEYQQTKVSQDSKNFVLTDIFFLVVGRFIPRILERVDHFAGSGVFPFILFRSTAGADAVGIQFRSADSTVWHQLTPPK